MAILKSSVHGKISGKIGNNVYRIVKNRVIIATTPAAYTTSYSPHAVKSRNILTSYSKFSSQVNKILSLSAIWDNTDLPGDSPYKKILNFNKNFLKNEFLSPLNSIAPRTLTNPVKSITFSSGKLTTTLEDNVFSPDSSDFTLHTVVALIKPKSKKVPFLLLTTSFEPVPVNTFNLVISLDKKFARQTSDYAQMIAYPCLTFTRDGIDAWLCDLAFPFDLS